MTRALSVLGFALISASAQAQDSGYYSTTYYSLYSGTETDTDTDADTDSDTDTDTDTDADTGDTDGGDKGGCSAVGAVGGWAALALGAGVVASRRRRQA